VNSDTSLSTALVDTVRSADLGSLSKDYGEVLLDSVISEGTLRDIPILGTLVAFGRVGISIKDQIFAKKLVRFLSNLAEVEHSDRLEMLDRLNNEDGFARQVGDRLIELLDRVDAYAKPEMLAKAFRAYASHTIDGKMLNRLNHAIERLPHYEIQSVPAFYAALQEARMEMSPTTLNSLVMAGLATPLPGWDALVYEPNDVCETFVALGLAL
jgi:hypothetical protein